MASKWGESPENNLKTQFDNIRKQLDESKLTFEKKTLDLLNNVQNKYKKKLTSHKTDYESAVKKIEDKLQLRTLTRSDNVKRSDVLKLRSEVAELTTVMENEGDRLKTMEYDLGGVRSSIENLKIDINYCAETLNKLSTKQRQIIERVDCNLNQINGINVAIEEENEELKFIKEDFDKHHSLIEDETQIEDNSLNSLTNSVESTSVIDIRKVEGNSEMDSTKREEGSLKEDETQIEDSSLNSLTNSVESTNTNNDVPRVEKGSEMDSTKKLTCQIINDICEDYLKSYGNIDDRFFIVRGKDKGKEAWHYVFVDEDKRDAFLTQSKTGNIDVALYGKVLYSGWGKDPPTTTAQRIDNICNSKVIVQFKADPQTKITFKLTYNNQLSIAGALCTADYPQQGLRLKYYNIGAFVYIKGPSETDNSMDQNIIGLTGHVLEESTNGSIKISINNEPKYVKIGWVRHYDPLWEVFEKGDFVLVCPYEMLLKVIQMKEGYWIDEMQKIAGKTGIIARLVQDGNSIWVLIDNYAWRIHPKALTKNTKSDFNKDSRTNLLEKTLLSSISEFRNALHDFAQKIDKSNIDGFCHGFTGLHLACREGFTDTVQLLLKNGANIEYSDINGNTPLHHAVIGHHCRIVEILLEAKAKTSVKNKRGQIAVDIASLIGNARIMKVLAADRNDEIVPERSQPSRRLNFLDKVIAKFRDIIN